MAVKIAVGKEEFDEIRREHSYYVDKTEMIYELTHETNNKVTLFTRPRRFGKTLNMTMMESFFDIRRDSRDMFSGLKIMEYSEFCKEWINQYPVLFLTLKGVDGLEFDKAYDMLKISIASLCKKHAYLIEKEQADKIDVDDAKIFQKLKAQTASEAEIKDSLKTIMRMMKAVYKKSVILLVDEYDVPLAKASEKNTDENKYYEKMLDVIKGIFDAALKTNEFLKFAVFTGCLRIAKESIFTGTNNFISYSVLDNDFSQYFGFTQDEVNGFIEKANQQEKADIIASWYNGYTFGNTYVYCPWDVVSYVAALIKRKNAKPKNYWKNTSHNGILLTFVERTEFDVTGKFETLMNGGTIIQTISDELTYDTLHESEENLWSVLLMTGYLTKANIEAEGETVELKIPNEEILNIFEDTVVTYFKETLDTTKQKELVEALWNSEEERASKLMTDILFDTISYHNYHEDYYHAFLAGIMKGLGYDVKSDDENGLGRTDVDIKDKKRRRAMVIENKKAASEEDMLAACKEALDQIVTREYLKGFSDFETVIGYGISFFQKKALIKKLK